MNSKALVAALFLAVAAIAAVLILSERLGKNAVVSYCKLFSDHNCIQFQVEGRQAVLVKPNTPASGRPWVWRALFFAHEPQVDLALLDMGYHVGFVDTAHLYGSNKAMEIWDAYFERALREHGLSGKAALEGMSRGALPLYRWAGANPESVCAIYADAPVTDFCSWPAGEGRGRGSKKDLKASLKAYGLGAGRSCSDLPSPIDDIHSLARAGVPILHVVGDADQIVPVAENSDVVVERYKASGGIIEVINKPGVGHHPHSLVDPAPIVGFIHSHCSPG